MNQICSSIVRMDWHIKFVCILDHNGKLLVGHDRNIPLINTNDSYKNTISSTNNLFNITNSNSKVDELVEIFLKHKNMYLFYSDYLLWILENCRLHLNDNHNKNNSNISQDIVENKASTYFEISGYDNDDDVKLAVTPLYDSKFRFLCIYFEPAYRIKNSFDCVKEVFENLLNNISTD
ncbi:MAG TPA: hypothetical protein VH500_04155, partial [Nitrososphaeraceae archaeon]